MLTKNELVILELITQGYSRKEISDILMISEIAAKKHITSIYRKIEVSNRVQATLKKLILSNHYILHPEEL